MPVRAAPSCGKDKTATRRSNTARAGILLSRNWTRPAFSANALGLTSAHLDRPRESSARCDMIRRLRSSWVGAIAGLVATATIISSVVFGAGSVRSLRVVGAGIGLAALVFAFVPILLLVRRGSPIEGKSYLHTTTLVDSGLYGVVRHPQYLAYILFMLTFGLFAQRVFVTVLASLASGLLYLNAILEEHDCAEKLGQGYQDCESLNPEH